MIMIRRRIDSEEQSPGDPLFQAGQLVRHRRYHYRGVVVDIDVSCKASNQWYENNQTQPDRKQPWYHVLVHGTTTITYPAEDSLEAESSGQEIDHPLIDHFFDGFHEGRYLRNERPWIT